MNYFKTLALSFIDSFKLFFSKELVELLYFSTHKRESKAVSKIFLIYMIFLSVMYFIKPNSIYFIIFFLFINIILIALLRPSVDPKGLGYLFQHLFIGVKLLSLFAIIFYIPYSIINIENSLLSLVIGILVSVFCLLIPYSFSILGVLIPLGLALLSSLLFIAFHSLIYHLMLVAYLNFEKIITFFCYIFMFDFKLFDIWGFASFVMSPFVVFLIISSLDSKPDFYHQILGLFRGLKFFFVNYPFSFVIFNLFKLIVILTERLLRIYFSSADYLLLPFYILYLSIFVSFYVKKIHEQFLVYF